MKGRKFQLQEGYEKKGKKWLQKLKEKHEGVERKSCRKYF